MWKAIFLTILNQNKVYNEGYLLGQSKVLQFLDSEDDPWQGFPSADGAGLVQVRVLVLLPVPQLLVQAEYFPHSLHWPFTAISKAN